MSDVAAEECVAFFAGTESAASRTYCSAPRLEVRSPRRLSGVSRTFTMLIGSCPSQRTSWPVTRHWPAASPHATPL
jgi:hypothetical protein